MNGLNKTKSAIFVSLMCSLLPEDLHSELILLSTKSSNIILFAEKKCAKDPYKFFFLTNFIITVLNCNI